MPRLARGEIIDPAEIQVVHCVQRCVRRAFLCGEDPLTGQSFEHRRKWIRQRLEFLASVFAIDCLTYTVMHNHIHLVLRSRPDVLGTWSDEEVARRWLRLFPHRRNKNGSPAEPTAPEINMIVNDPDRLTERRRRLSDLSWWMRCTAENIARRSNAEDQVTGHFWEGRYKAIVLLDEASLLACSAYVDLNPVRAAIAETPESSNYTDAAAADSLRSVKAIRSRKVWIPTSVSSAALVRNAHAGNDARKCGASQNLLWHYYWCSLLPRSCSTPLSYLGAMGFCQIQ